MASLLSGSGGVHFSQASLVEDTLHACTMPNTRHQEMMERVAAIEKKLSMIQSELIGPNSVLLAAYLQNPFSPEAVYFKSQCDRIMVLRRNLEFSSRCYLDQQQMIASIVKEKAKLVKTELQGAQIGGGDAKKSDEGIASDQMPAYLGNAPPVTTATQMATLVETLNSNALMTASNPQSLSLCFF